MKMVKVTFTATGSIEQTVKLSKDITPQEFQDGLDYGRYFTTAQEGGDVLEMATEDVGKGIIGSGAFVKIGEVVSSDIELSYDVFDVDEDDEYNEAEEKWADNSIQFPRLLAELNAFITYEQVAEVAKSMDLEQRHVFDLLARAEAEFEKIKNNI